VLLRGELKFSAFTRRMGQANCKVQTTHKKGSHEEHKEHKGLESPQKPGFFFVSFVSFVA